MQVALGTLCKVSFMEHLLFFLLVDTPRFIQHVLLRAWYSIGVLLLFLWLNSTEKQHKEGCVILAFNLMGCSPSW